MMQRCTFKNEVEYFETRAVPTMNSTCFVRDPNFEWLLLALAGTWLFGLTSQGAGARAEHAIVTTPQINVGAPK